MTTNPPAADRARVRILILAGGASSRFFPVNKVFADPTGAGRTMIQQAFDRVTAVGEGGDRFVSPEQFFVVTGADSRAAILEQLPLPRENVFVEPARRNTWPAILWALAHLRIAAPDATVAILTADHVIGELPRFRKTLEDAVRIAQSEPAIVTIGIQPSADANEWTAFGTIRAERAGSGPARIARFEEKPKLERVAEMMEEGGWSWNGGMFVFGVDTAEKALGVLQPAMGTAYSGMLEAIALERPEEAAAHFEELGGKIPHPLEPGRQADNSIDFAIMMPLTQRAPEGLRGYVIPATFPWRDIGSWDALLEIAAKDAAGNVRVGDVSCDDVRGSVLVAQPGRAIEIHGLVELVVVHGEDGAVLVTPVRLAPEIKPLVEKVRATTDADTVALDCTDCRIDAGGLKIAALGLDGVEIRGEGARVVVGPVDSGG